MLVQLSASEVDICQRDAVARTRTARREGIINRKMDESRSDEQVDLFGCMGEMAVCKLFGVPYEEGRSLDDGYDILLGDIRVDVKTTAHANGRLLFRSVRGFKADAAVLVQATDLWGVVRVAGFCTADHFRKHCQRFTTNPADESVILPTDYLLPIQHLWAMWRFGAVGMKEAAPQSDPFDLSN